jgi:hypothetical protein
MQATRNQQSGLYEAEIDGVKYEFSKWGADDANDVLLDLASILGKPLGMGAAAFFGKDRDGEKKLDKTMDPNVIGAIMEALSGQIGANKVTVKALIKKLAAEGVFCNGKPITFNTHYADRLGHQFRVVKTALEVQFGNFFGELTGLVGIQVPEGMAGIMNRGPQT